MLLVLIESWKLPYANVKTEALAAGQKAVLTGQAADDAL